MHQRLQSSSRITAAAVMRGRWPIIRNDARQGTVDRGEYRQAAGAIAQAVIRSVELIAQPAAKDPVGEMGVREGLSTGDMRNHALSFLATYCDGRVCIVEVA